MITGGVQTTGLSQVFRTQTNNYSRVLEQIASGQRFTRPSDDFASFMRTNTLQSDNRAVESENRALAQARQDGQAAATFGNSLFEGLQELRTLMESYAETTDTNEQAAITAEFNARRDALAELVDGNRVTTLTANLGTNTAGTTQNAFTMALSDTEFSFANLSGASAISISGTTAATALDTMTTAAAGYTASANAFVSTVDRQLTINENVFAARENTISAVRGIDEVRAIQEATNLEIRRHASISMLAQANVSQGIMARLYS